MFISREIKFILEDHQRRILDRIQEAVMQVPNVSTGKDWNFHLTRSIADKFSEGHKLQHSRYFGGKSRYL